MTILLVNDDGIESLAVNLLYEELSKRHSVYMVCPSGNRSGSSHSITVFRSVKVRRISDRVFSVDGTPADCVKIGILSIVKERVDLTVSGINVGPNLGLDIYYSGTFSAARESAMLGVRSMSFSVNVGWEEVEERLFRQCALFVSKVVDFYPVSLVPVDVFPNVNIPRAHFSDIKGVVPARPYERYYFETSYLEERRTSEVEEECVYVLNGGVREHLELPDSDISLCKNDYIVYTMYSYYPFKDVTQYEIICYEGLNKAFDFVRTYFSS